jgi:hypothetical protein
MNKVLTIIFLAIISYSKAATGSASDGPLFVIAIIGMILLIVGIGSFIDLMKSKFKEYKARKLVKRNSIDQNDDFLNSFNKSIPEIDGISSY